MYGHVTPGEVGRKYKRRKLTNIEEVSKTVSVNPVIYGSDLESSK